ncbi:hypothetical protein OPT61_g10592 [Boeremia exigua]|uniref:Uncharacterized protein n=1 Tax=Boeremia exigua TaxID=749465 RepID=A0ACC2HNY1_9PLEO|nr:hypothetical protein OPT61_g10592 [Boeremia exigua]
MWGAGEAQSELTPRGITNGWPVGARASDLDERRGLDTRATPDAAAARPSVDQRLAAKCRPAIPPALPAT